MRRRSFLGVLAAGALGLTGCGGGEDPRDAATGDTAGGSFPAKVQHRYGTTTVSKAPERVVVVGLREQDALLAMGVVPVAVTKWLDRTIQPWAASALGDAKAPVVLPASDGIDIEKVAAQRPDLIVGVYSGMTKREFETLSKLAPTVAPPADVPNYGTDFRVETTMVGTAIGKPADAKRLVAGVDTKVAATRKANPDFAGKTAAAATTYQGVYVFGSTDARPRLLRELGFSIPKGIDAVTQDDFGAELSKERLDLLDTDVLLWQIEKNGRKAVEDDPAVAALQVAKQDRIVFSAPGTLDDAITYATVLSLPVAIDGLTPKLAAALARESS